MTDYPPGILRVAPHAIPTIRAAFDAALNELIPAVGRLGDVGHIPGPWLGDPVSRRVQEVYNARVMDAPDGPYQAMVAYQGELQRIRDQLVAMEAEYRRTDGDAAELWGRL